MPGKCKIRERMITKYGLSTAIPILVISIIVVLIGLYVSNIPARIALIAVGSFVFLFTLNFFRDPDRTTPDVPDGIISPADGTVVQIIETDEPEFMGGRVRQISIFMSPLNVHVNRYPVSGRVAFFRYIKGEYLVAFDEKSSTRNERTLIGIDNRRFKVLFKQIAGFVARRIVCPVAVGDSAVAGERFGMIRFGSRVDVLVPLDAEIRVKLDDKTTAGETVLAVMPAGRTSL
jgi:phosphatidylserine decarboxylase